MILESCPKITGNDPPGSPGSLHWPLLASRFCSASFAHGHLTQESELPAGAARNNNPYFPGFVWFGPQISGGWFFCWWDGNPWIKGTSIIFENKTSHNLCVPNNKKSTRFQGRALDSQKKMVQIVQIEKFDSLNCPKNKIFTQRMGSLNPNLFGWNSLGWRVEAQLKCQNLRWAYTNTLRAPVL